MLVVLTDSLSTLQPRRRRIQVFIGNDPLLYRVDSVKIMTTSFIDLENRRSYVANEKYPGRCGPQCSDHHLLCSHSVHVGTRCRLMASHIINLHRSPHAIIRVHFLCHLTCNVVAGSGVARAHSTRFGALLDPRQLEIFIAPSTTVQQYVLCVVCARATACFGGEELAMRHSC